jgi:hypothetical protein
LNSLGGGVSRPGSLVVILVIEARCTPSATQKLFLSNKGVRTAPIALNALTGWEIHPQLDSVEQSTRNDEFLRWGLDMENSRTSGHPLRRSVRDQAASTIRVLVGERAIDHVGDRLEAAVRVPGSAFRLTRGVLDLSHLVHVYERIERAEADSRECSAYGKSLSLEPVGGR